MRETDPLPAPSDAVRVVSGPDRIGDAPPQFPFSSNRPMERLWRQGTAPMPTSAPAPATFAPAPAARGELEACWGSKVDENLAIVRKHIDAMDPHTAAELHARHQAHGDDARTAVELFWAAKGR